MNTPRKVALALAFAGVLGLGLWSYRGKTRPTHPIDAVPPDAFIAVDIDVAGLRKSGALRAIFGDRDEQSLTEVCGFDPVDRMQDLVFTVPEGGDGSFGVAVDAALSQDELVKCADEIVKGHGGDPTSDVSSYGSYSIITPRSTSAESTKPPRSLGYHKGSPILVGPKGWLVQMVDAIDAASEERGSPGQHLRLRTELAKEITPKPTFLLTATVLLERSVREKLKEEMAAEVGPGADPGTSMMLGVLGTSAGVLGVYEQGDEVRAQVDLTCEEERQCGEVQLLIEKVRGEWSKMPELRAFGLGPVLDHLDVSHHGTELEVRAGAPTIDVLRWAKLFLDAKPMLAGAASPATASSSDAPVSTIRIRVPDGVKPGEPFTVRVPAPIGATSAAPAGVKTLQATVPFPTTMPPPRPNPPPP